MSSRVAAIINLFFLKIGKLCAVPVTMPQLIVYSRRGTIYLINPQYNTRPEIDTLFADYQKTARDEPFLRRYPLQSVNILSIIALYHVDAHLLLASRFAKCLCCTTNC